MDYKGIILYIISHHWGKLAGGLAGLFLALLFIFFGFWRTLLILTLIIAGIIIGARLIDKDSNLKDFFNEVWNNDKF